VRLRPEVLTLRRVNPLTKLVAAVVYMAIATIVFDAMFQFALLVVLVVALVALERVRPLQLVKVLLPFALVGFGYLWANLLFYDSVAYYSDALAREAILGSPAADAGITLFLRALCFGVISYVFVRSTDPADLMRGLTQQARLPAHIGFSVFSALQFLPYLRDEARQIRLARAMRENGRSPWISRLRDAMGLIIPLLAATIRKASRAAISMEARGLRRPMARTSLHRSSFERSDVNFAAAAVLLLVMLLAWRHWPQIAG
jgi:energy-coupling factor transport system permease protein